MEKVFESIYQNSKIIYILRGPPGCGKSTLASQIKSKYPKSLILSADSYRYHHDPKTKSTSYHYNVKENDSLYAKCQMEAKALMSQSRSPIIIDNTNIKVENYIGYIKLAQQFDYSVYVTSPDTEWVDNVEELTKRNIHKVPTGKIKGMLRDFEVHKPLYYGWFLPAANGIKKKSVPNDVLFSNEVVNIFQDSLRSMMKQDIFIDFLKDKFNCIDTTRIWSSTINIPVQLIGQSKPENGPLHITSCFVNNDETFNNYSRQNLVRDALRSGRVDSFNILGIIFTKKVIGLRIGFHRVTQKVLPTFWFVDDKQKYPQCSPDAVLHRKVGCRAHMTLGVTEDGKASDTGVELLKIVDLEYLNETNVRRTTLPDVGILNYYVKYGLVYLKFQQPKSFYGLFNCYYVA